MSINNLTEEELLVLAQNKKPLPKDAYESSKSSVYNYVKLLNFRMGTTDEIAFRVPLDLAYLHYSDWLTDNYPHILLHSLKLFSKEMIEYVNHIKIKNIYYLIIRNCAQFRTYKTHPYNVFLKNRSRKLNNTWQRKRNR